MPEDEDVGIQAVLVMALRLWRLSLFRYSVIPLFPSVKNEFIGSLLQHVDVLLYSETI